MEKIFNWTPLQYAISKGHFEIIQLLLYYPGIEINLQDGIFFHHFLIKELLIRTVNFTALHYAVFNRYPELVYLLLNVPNIQVNIEDEIYF